MQSASARLNCRGVELPFDRGIISDRIMSAIREGWYEGPEAASLPFVLQSGERVLELGTGLGLISTLCAMSPLVEGVVTVEANPELIAYIREVHRLNHVAHRIEVMNAVAMPAPSASETSFYLRRDVWASSLAEQPWGYERIVKVPTLDLNELIRKLRPTMMIVDIEGGEEHLFDAIELGTVVKILIELHQDVIGRRGMKWVFDQLSRRSFHYDQWHSEKGVVLFSHVDRDRQAS